MAPLTHLSPKERYQVVYYIRESLLKDSPNGAQEVNDEYLASLPKGEGTGEFVQAGERDYGPVLASQLGSEVNNALSFRLPDRITVCYDLHRMRLAGAWNNGFLDLSQTHHYRQRGERMPQIEGDLLPGLSAWAWAFDGGFEIGEDDKPPRGPLRSDWLRYDGHYLYGDRAILSYGIEGRDVLESITAQETGDFIAIEHTLRVAAGEEPLKLLVAQLNSGQGPSGLIVEGDDQVSERSGSANGSVAVVVGQPERRTRQRQAIAAAAAAGDVDGLTWKVGSDGRITLTIPASDEPRNFRVVQCSTETEQGVLRFRDYMKQVASRQENVDLTKMTTGGKQRWPEILAVDSQLGEPINGYALDTIAVPFENPWNAWVRTSALDFFDDGTAVVTTHGGDVYLVRGIDSELKHVTWKRYAAGLFEPFGVRVVDGTIYVTCRDGLKRLHDYNNDDEADFIEAFWIDDDLSSMFHAFNFDLQTDSDGNFYFAKSGQYSHHHRPGTIMRVRGRTGAVRQQREGCARRTGTGIQLSGR